MFTSHDRAYFGTDSRAFSFIGGVLLAQKNVFQSFHTSKNKLFQSTRNMNVIGTSFFLLSFGALLFGINEKSTFTFTFVLQLSAFIFVSLIYFLIEYDSTLRRFPELSPVRFVGRISYSLYLWHWPIQIYWPKLDFLNSYSDFLAKILCSILIATASYFLIEKPFQSLGHGIKSTKSFVLLICVLVSFVSVFLLFKKSKPIADFYTANGSLISAGSTQGGILFLGDSVLASIEDDRMTEARERGLNVALAPVSGCGILPGQTLDQSLSVYAPSIMCVHKPSETQSERLLQKVGHK